MEHNLKPKNSFFNPEGNTIRSVAIAFSLILLVLVSVSVLSFFRARKIEESYKSVVTDAMLKLELVNKMHENEDAVYSNVLGHLSTSSMKIKTHYEERIAAVNEDNYSIVLQLRELLKNDGLLLVLKEYETERQEYDDFIQNHLRNSRARASTKPDLISAYTLAHVSSGHQRLLIQLNDSIRRGARERGDKTIESLNTTNNNFNVLLLVALLLALTSGFLVLNIIKQLKKDNLLLNIEIADRQQLELALGESQRQFKNLFNYNPVPLWVYNQQDLRFLEVNEAAIKEYGYSHQEFLSLKLTEIIAPDETKSLENMIDVSARGTTPTTNSYHKRKDGSVFCVETIAHPLPATPQLQPGIVVAINVDEKQRALTQLKNNEKQLREISSSIPGAVFQFKLDAERELAFTFISEGIKTLTGISPNEVYADVTVLFKRIQPDDSEKVKTAVLTSFTQLTPLEEEYRIWLPDQQIWKWIRVQGLPTLKQDSVTWNGTFIDITKQKEAQQLLVKSEANLRAMLNSSPEAIYLLDQDMNIILFNRVAVKVVETYKDKSLEVGQHILQYLDEHFVDSMMENHANAMQGQTVIYETEWGDFWLEVAFRPIFDPEKNVLAVSFSTLDISEQKHALETIKRSERQLARAQQLAHLGNWEYDLLRNEMTWSDGVFDIHKLNKASFWPTFYNKNTFIHPDDRERVSRKLEEAMQKKRLYTDEYRIVLADGSERVLYEIVEADFDETGRATKMSGAVQDITNRKEVEREVIEARNLLQSTLENIPEVIFSTDAQFHISYISSQCLELTGYPEPAFYKNPALWLELIHPEDRQQLTDLIIPNLKAGLRQQCEVRIKSKGNQEKWLMTRLSPLLDENETVLRIDGSASDMTQSKIAEEKRNQLTEDLLRQNQNLQQFAYIVSHNLRAPIANIMGLTSIYDPTNHNEESNIRIIDNLKKSSNVLDATIRDLNDILTIRSDISGLQEEIFFSQILKRIEEGLNKDLKTADIELQYDFEEAPSILTIKSYLHSIMLNLVSNAIKYKSPDRKLKLQLKSFRLPSYICLRVSDNGIGIDLAKHQDKIFGLYRRFHPGIDGKGLGLHLVKTQAELLGGRVEVESQVNVGTTFIVYFKSLA